jgi:GNAT superfamily N-acetyltransferase
MNDINIIECNDDESKIFRQKLFKYNQLCVPFTQEDPIVKNFNFKAVLNNQVVGGIIGKMYCWNVVSVDILFIAEGFRKRGIGSSLIKYIEKFAIDNKCSLIHLDTFDFQAKEFYLKMGYQVFGELNDCPPGHSRFYLCKKI